MEAEARGLVPCPVCGIPFDPEAEVAACRVCPLGGLVPRCGLIRCPQCGFEQPAPRGLRARVRRRGREEAGSGGPGGPGRENVGRRAPESTGPGPGWDPVRLSDLAEGERARVLRLEARGSGLRKLLAMGVLPGIEVAMVQARPVPVIRAGFTTMAIDAELARAVAVLRLAPGPGGPGPRRRRWGRRWRRDGPAGVS